MVSTTTKQKMFFNTDFFSKCDQIHRKLRTWSHLLMKSLKENYIFLCSERFPSNCLSKNITLGDITLDIQDKASRFNGLLLSLMTLLCHFTNHKNY